MIKVFEYMESDLDSMKFNHWGRLIKGAKKIKKVKQYLKENHAFTLWDEKPIAILGFDEYDENKYYGLIIADECFSDNPKYAIKMKWLIKKVIDVFGMKRVQTISEDDPQLNKWHEFLGFKLEQNDVFTYKGVHHILWGMEWE